MHQITLFQDKKYKHFLGRPHPQRGAGHPFPHSHAHPRRLQRLDARYSAPSAPRLRLKDAYYSATSTSTSLV